MNMSVASIINQEEIPAILVNSMGFIVDINSSFEKTYGYKKSIVVGKPLSTIIPVNMQASHHIGFSRFLNTEKPTLLNKPINLSVQHANGTVMMAEHTIVAEKIDDQWVFAATIALKAGA